MNVLGVLFDCTLNWAHHINKVLSKASSAKYAIRMIAKFFNKKELNEIITAYYFSILYYNAEIWLLPTLPPLLKQKLLSSSANILRISINNHDRMLSFTRIHKMANRATPEMMSKYKHALQLHKIYNDTGMGEDWIQLNFNQNFNSRLTKFITTDTSRYKIGKNRMSNRLRVINNEIELSDLNKSYNAFKMLMKKLYLSGTPIT